MAAADKASLRARVAELHAETLALRAILFELMVGLRTSGAVDRLYLESAFDNAASSYKALGITMSEQAGPQQMAGAVRVIEQLRDQFVASKSRPEQHAES
jgi:hypothetical protein